MHKCLALIPVVLVIAQTAFCQQAIRSDNDLRRQMNRDNYNMHVAQDDVLVNQRSQVNIAPIDNSIAQDALKANNYPEAIKYFGIAIKRDPTYADAYNNRGMAEYHIHDLKGAIKDFNKAALLDNKNRAYRLNAANAKYDAQDFKGTIKDLTKLIKKTPDDFKLYTKRGRAEKEMKQYKKAIGDFDKAINLNPKYSPAYLNKGNAELEFNQNDNACADWAKAKELGNKAADQLISQNCR